MPRMLPRVGWGSKLRCGVLGAVALIIAGCGGGGGNGHGCGFFQRARAYQLFQKSPPSQT